MADNFFWTNSQLEPKRGYRFTCTILGNSANPQTALPNGASYFIKTVQKPGIEISAKEHMYLGHKFFYPGLVTWNPNPIEIKLIDPVTPDASNALAAILEGSGYVIPNSPTTLTAISKNKAVTSLGGILIQQRNEEGIAIETWDLQNAFIKSVKFGDLDYSKEDLTEITLQVQYDYCLFDSTVGVTKFNPQ
jgi:hypothetical protein